MVFFMSVCNDLVENMIEMGLEKQFILMMVDKIVKEKGEKIKLNVDEMVKKRMNKKVRDNNNNNNKNNN